MYVTVNILAHNGDLPGVREYLQELKELKPDALIIADPGIFTYAQEICPEIERHISTQANNTNYETYKFWYRLGAKRVVTARELSLKEIQEIRANISGGYGDRDICTWSDVYFLFRPLPAQQLSGRKRCEPGGLHTSVPLEVFRSSRRSVRVSICRYLRMREEPISSTPRISAWYSTWTMS